jgi:hypothetical protein
MIKMQLFFTKPPFQGSLMSDFELLPLLLSTLDDKTLASLRFKAVQYDSNNAASTKQATSEIRDRTAPTGPFWPKKG